MKKKSFKNWKLYVITDPKTAQRRSLTETVREAVEGGASVVQLRNKKASDAELISCAKDLLKITKPKRVPLIINDRIMVAKLSGADGVHLGQEDASFEEARTILGKKAIIGRSTHSQTQAIEAQEEGFDYIGVGPVFKTPTKPKVRPVGLKLVEFAAKNIRIPFVAIGGIDEGNVKQVARSGAKTVAVVRAVMQSEDPRRSVKNILKKIG